MIKQKYVISSKEGRLMAFSNDKILCELEMYARILETHFRDMQEFDFCVENGELFIVSTQSGKRSALASVRIALSMFVEGKIEANECIALLDPIQVADLMEQRDLVNENEVFLIGRGLPASPCPNSEQCGIATYTIKEAEYMAINHLKYVLCITEATEEHVDAICSAYCCGVITSRGGMTSHAAAICRFEEIPCVSGMNNAIFVIQEALRTHRTQYVTLNSSNGNVYVGQGKYEKLNQAREEIACIAKLIMLGIKCNLWENDVVLNAWSLWDVIVNGKRFSAQNSVKQPILHPESNYHNFGQPTKIEMNEIYSKLSLIDNCSELAEGLIKHLIRQLSKQVPVGEHYRYLRPIFDPEKTLQVTSVEEIIEEYTVSKGTQLTGIEFFNINRFLDCYIDIHKIRVVFSTRFSSRHGDHQSINFLDHTNPFGESLVVNNWSADSIAIQVNDAWLDAADLISFYHFFRRRIYDWKWYKENHVTKYVIIEYLKSGMYLHDSDNELFHLCQEVNLLDGCALTSSGKSLIGDL